MADQPENALAFLKMCTIHPEMKNIKVTFILDESEKEILPTAYELGLNSWFKKPFTKNSLEQELKSIMARFSANEWNATLVAAEFLREHLRESKDYKKWLAFERSLSEVYPGNPKLLLKLAEPLLLNKEEDAGRSALRQAVLLNPD